MAEPTFGPVAELLVSWLVTYLLHSTLVLGGAALASGRLVRSVARVDLLWKSALLAPLASATLQVGLGYAPLAGAWTPAAAARAGRWLALPPAPGGGAGAAALDAGVGRGTSLLAPALVLAWLAVAGLGLAGVVRSHRRFRRFMERRAVEDAELLGIFAELHGQAGLRRPVRLSVAPACSSPVALGWSEVCVPGWFLHTLEPLEQRSILAHELAHLARGDALWQTGALVLSRVMFFQPLNGVARRRMVEVAEYACDDHAVRRTGTPLGLLRALAAVAERHVERAAPPAVGAAAMAATPSAVLARAERLVNGRREPPRSVAAGDLVLAALGVCVVAIAAPAWSMATPPKFEGAVEAGSAPGAEGGPGPRVHVLRLERAPPIPELLERQKPGTAPAVYVARMNRNGADTAQLRGAEARILELLQEVGRSGTESPEELLAGIVAAVRPAPAPGPR
ncbi:MAG TPA: M56 family metallopeptidase [Longimicrobium sp.]|uniref:M56 family metallopeptidase n=1 Tax=Longimicrobium sp. TaxID=2029185 RepID=UPI002ED8090F